MALRQRREGVALPAGEEQLRASGAECFDESLADAPARSGEQRARFGKPHGAPSCATGSARNMSP